MNTTDYIPVYEYALKSGKSRQEVYRLIREGRFDPKDIIKIEKTVKRIMIKKTAKKIR